MEQVYSTAAPERREKKRGVPAPGNRQSSLQLTEGERHTGNLGTVKSRYCQVTDTQEALSEPRDRHPTPVGRLLEARAVRKGEQELASNDGRKGVPGQQ